MMKRLLIISLLFVFYHGSAQAFQEIVAVQSIRVKPYEEAIEGFIEGLEKAGEPIPEEVTPVEMDTISV